MCSNGRIGLAPSTGETLLTHAGILPTTFPSAISRFGARSCRPPAELFHLAQTASLRSLQRSSLRTGDYFQGSILLRPKESEISRPEMWQLPNIVHVDLRDIDLNVLRTAAQLAPESTVFVTDRKNQRRVLHEVCRETKGLRSRVFHRSVQSTFAYKKE